VNQLSTNNEHRSKALNKDVRNGQANGSMVKLQRVTVKCREQPIIIRLSCGAKVRVYFASQISALTVCHEVDDIVPREFEIHPKSYSFIAKVLIRSDKGAGRIKGRQLPIMSNGATTGQKLQGRNLHSLVVF
jgi:hypothetical protein